MLCEKIPNSDASSTLWILFEDRKILFSDTTSTYTHEVLRKTGRFLEYDLLADARRFLLPHDIVIDVGAHVGNHTIFFAAICDCFVVAFEPDPKNYRMLRRTVLLNALEKQVDLHQAALSSESGVGEMVDAPIGRASTRRLSLLSDGTVPVMRLDDLELARQVRVLKIDVEGHELQVLLGATKLIERHLPRIYVECLDEDHFSMVARHLARFEYRAVACFADAPTFVFSREGKNEFMTSADHEFGVAAIHQRCVRMRKISELSQRVASAKAARRREAERSAKAVAARKRVAERAATAEAARKELAKELNKLKKSRTYRIALLMALPARIIHRLRASILG